MSSSGKQIRIGAVLSYLSVFLGIVSGLVYHPWMIRMIGDADYGLYTLAMSLINIFLIDFGLDMASQRYISRHRAEGDQQTVDNMVGLIYKLYLFITAVLLVVFVVLYFFVDRIYVKLTPVERDTFKTLYVLVAIYSVTSFPFVTLKGILSSYEQFIPLKTSDLLYKIISVALTAAALAMGYGVYTLVVVNLIASLTVTGLRLYFIRCHTPVRANFAYFDLGKIRELMGFSIWSSVSVVTMRLLLALGPSILGILSGSFEIAVFGYAVSMEGHIFSFVNAINGFFMPRLSKISLGKDAVQNSGQVLQLMVTVGKFILILYGLIFVGFATMGREFILLLVGPDYVKAHACVLLICGYGIVAYPQQIANTYVIVQNRVKERAMVSLGAFAVYGVLAFGLSFLWGSIGLSLAICLSLVAQTVAMNVLYIRLLGIDVFSFFKQCHLKLLPGFLVFSAVAVAITHLPWTGWRGFFMKVLLITGVYAVIIWRMFLDRKERDKAVRAVKRKLVGG